MLIYPYLFSFSVTEIVGPKYRSWVGMAMPILFSLAYVTVALFGHYIRDFRVLQAVTVSHQIIFAVLFWYTTLPYPSIYVYKCICLIC